MADPEFQIGLCVCVCVWGGGGGGVGEPVLRGGGGEPVISGGGGAVSRSLPWMPTEMCMKLEGLLGILLTVNKLK